MTTLEIGGKLRPFRLSFRALENWQRRTGKELGQIVASLPDSRVIIHEGLKAGARELQETALTEDELLDCLDADAGLLLRGQKAVHEEMAILVEQMGEQAKKMFGDQKVDPQDSSNSSTESA